MFQLRQVLGAVGEGIGDEAHRGAGREDVGAAGDVFLEDVVLDRAAELGGIGALFLGDDLVHQEEERGGGVDRHRGGDRRLVDAVEEAAHVVEGADGDADAADLAEGAGIVGIDAELGGEVEGDAEAGDAALEEELVAPVGFLGGGEPGVLAHGPGAGAVHGGVDAAGVGEVAGIRRAAESCPGAS